MDDKLRANGGPTYASGFSLETLLGSVPFSIRTENVGTPSILTGEFASKRGNSSYSFRELPGRNYNHPNFTGIFDFQSATWKKY
ncbi:hypothetical protein [Leptospira barantonii]|uniref:hypothetical protein n=1 Tax=Leptospira barantonii TaxID=2023184 RepID=UPI000F64D81E|nr:hypothetical protein [Leptospira barantonii]